MLYEECLEIKCHFRPIFWLKNGRKFKLLNKDSFATEKDKNEDYAMGPHLQSLGTRSHSFEGDNLISKYS